MRRAVALALLTMCLSAPAAEAQHSRPTSRPSGGGAGPAEPVTSPGGLTFTAPDGWEQQDASSRMRVVQYVLPRAEGDDEDASLVIYYFGGGQGGSVEANVERWLAQFRQPDGSSNEDAAELSEGQVAGLDTHFVDVSGTFVAETRPGSGERVNKPGFRMLAAIVLAPGGPHFLKLVGPEDTVARWEESWEEFLDDVTVEQ
jgi:hypothetical protein